MLDPFPRCSTIVFVAAAFLRKVWRALEQSGHGRQVVRLVQRSERDEALERLERLRVHPHRSRVLEPSMNDAMPDADQLVTGQAVDQEVTEILDGAIVTECRPTP